MKYYSNELNKLFETEEECLKAEQEALDAKKKAEEEKEKLLAERKARAAEVDEKRKAMLKAQKEYEETLSDFLRDYKSYHYSTTSIEDMPKLFDLDWFFKF